jgi:DNA invertase Pin-like site-specific DNA recombinase
MPRYGYARVSTLDQDLSIQRAALKGAGCEVIRAEKASGTRRDGRSELQVLLDFVHAGERRHVYWRRRHAPGTSAWRDPNRRW